MKLPKTLKVKPGREREVHEILKEAQAIKSGLGFKGNATLMVDLDLDKALLGKKRLGDRRSRIKKTTRLLKQSLLSRLADCLVRPWDESTKKNSSPGRGR